MRYWGTLYEPTFALSVKWLIFFPFCCLKTKPLGYYRLIKGIQSNKDTWPSSTIPQGRKRTSVGREPDSTHPKLQEEMCRSGPQGLSRPPESKLFKSVPRKHSGNSWTCQVISSNLRNRLHIKINLNLWICSFPFFGDPTNYLKCLVVYHNS